MGIVPSKRILFSVICNGHVQRTGSTLNYVPVDSPMNTGGVRGKPTFVLQFVFEVACRDGLPSKAGLLGTAGIQI